ncbi:MAG: large subunit ribosomal protein L9 [Saprospiraceae bacterium]|jgi:large subunit ribosomal protein L9
MEIILLKDVEFVGYKHDVISVKNGYGRNYLIPQGMAVIANAANKEKLDKIIADLEAAETSKLDDYKTMAAKLDGQTLKIGVKAGTSGKIFGSVTNLQVANALVEQMQAEVERKKIILDENIKEVGTYEVILQLHKEVTAKINIELIAE